MQLNLSEDMNHQITTIMKKNLLILILHSSFFIFYSSLHAQWSDLGGVPGSTTYYIFSVCSDASGNIYAGGDLRNSSFNRFVAKWDGIEWSELVGLNGLAAGSWINSICGDASGNIYAGGIFNSSSTNWYIAKWDGTAWSELGGQNGLAANSNINSICSDASGNIYAGGGFSNSSGNYYVAKWDGTAWSELGGQNGLATIGNGYISSVCSDASGNIYAGGWLTNSTGNQYVAKWDGTAWIELGELNGLAAIGNGGILSVCSDSTGNIYAGGSFINSSGNRCVSKWDGTAWSELGGQNGLAANDRNILSVCSDAFGNIYAGGWFINSSGNYYVAKWDGTAWSELGGLNGLAANYEIYSVYSDASGNIYAGGGFRNSSGITYVAKYNVMTGIWSASGDEWQMKIFPNPARNEINISPNNMVSEKNLFFTLVDLQGRNVLEQPYESLKPIDVSTLPEGIYIATLKGKDREVSGKVMIKR